MSKSIAIAGHTGLIGTALKEYFSNYNIILLGREDLKEVGSIKEKISDVDIVINLVGKNLNTFWTKKNKDRFYSTRINTTKSIVSAINQLDKNIVLYNSSAVGLYKDDNFYDESCADFDNDFLSSLIIDWENEVKKVNNNNYVIFRLGVVLSSDASIIKALNKSIFFGFGAWFGSGNQLFSYIHLIDVIKGLDFLIKNKCKEEIINFVCPQIVSNKELVKVYAKVLKRRAFFGIPKFLVKLLFGERSSLLLKSNAVIPSRLKDLGYTFTFNTLKDCLINIESSE